VVSAIRARLDRGEPLWTATIEGARRRDCTVNYARRRYCTVNDARPSATPASV